MYLNKKRLCEFMQILSQYNLMQLQFKNGKLKENNERWENPSIMTFTYFERKKYVQCKKQISRNSVLYSKFLISLVKTNNRQLLKKGNCKS